MLDPLLVTALSQGIGLLAVLAIGYGAIERSSMTPSRRAIVLGLWFGIGAILAMSAPAKIGDGLIMDVRCIVIGLAAAFGAPATVAISTAMAIAFRLYLGGVGAVPGSVAIMLAAMLGFVGIIFLRRAIVGPLLRYALLGFVISLNFLSALLFPIDKALQLFSMTYPLIAVVSVVAACLLGSFMDRERRMMVLEEHWRVAALTDPLTGLPNRRFFERVAGAMLADCASSRGCCLLVIDIDHFKTINDAHGHVGGDVVLGKMADVLRRCLRDLDHAARIGGEEFAVLLPSVDIAGGMSIAERVRSEIAGEKEWGIRDVRVTASIGIAAASVPRTYRSLFRSADEALYRAKRSGRNRVVLSTTDDTVSPSIGRAPAAAVAGAVVV